MSIYNNKTTIWFAMVFVGWCLLMYLIIKLVVNNKIEESINRKWYVKHLRYDFSAKVDTAFILRNNHGYGRIFCTPTTDIEQEYLVEDSLSFVEDSISRHQTLLKHRFLWLRKDGQANFMIIGGEIGTLSDSVYINSKENVIRLFSKGQLVGEDEITTSIELNY